VGRPWIERVVVAGKSGVWRAVRSDLHSHLPVLESGLCTRVVLGEERVVQGGVQCNVVAELLVGVLVLVARRKNDST
jgi:hypothetical protein